MTPTDPSHSDNRYPDDTYLQRAMDDDARLQPDPQLAMSEGRASRAQIWMVALGAIVVAALVLYGITQPPRETQTAASPSAQTTGAAPTQDAQQPAPEQAKPGPSDSAR